MSSDYLKTIEAAAVIVEEEWDGGSVEGLNAALGAAFKDLHVVMPCECHVLTGFRAELIEGVGLAIKGLVRPITLH